MPFVQVDIKEGIEKHRQEAPTFRKAWDESREEYKLIREMISIRKQEKIMQSSFDKVSVNHTDSSGVNFKSLSTNLV